MDATGENNPPHPVRLCEVFTRTNANQRRDQAITMASMRGISLTLGFVALCGLVACASSESPASSGGSAGGSSGQGGAGSAGAAGKGGSGGKGGSAAGGSAGASGVAAGGASGGSGQAGSGPGGSGQGGTQGGSGGSGQAGGSGGSGQAGAGGSGGSGQAGSGGSGGSGQAGAGGAPCGDPEAMLPAWVGAAPASEVYLAPDGDDANDGASAAKALRSTAAAFARLKPGVRLNVKAGTYDCAGAYLQGQPGTSAAPIVIRSVDGPRAAKFDCQQQGGFLFERVSFLAVDGIELSNVGQGHGLQLSSGSPFNLNDLSHDVVVAHSYIHHTNLASIKASQARVFHVIGSEFSHAPPTRQLLEFVAVDQVIIAGNDGHDAGLFNEIKGGSKDSVIYRNRVHDSTNGILVGGDSTGYQFLIDPSADYEARNLRVWDNLIVNVGSEAFRVVGCKDCVIANNTFYTNKPTNSALRYLSVGFGGPNGEENYKPANNDNVRVVNNVFASLTGFVYMIPSNRPEGLTLDHNAWWVGAGGDVNAVGSDVPFKGEPASLYNVDPQLPGAPADLTPAAGSPLVGKGAVVDGVPGNALGACWNPPSIGAL